MTVPRHYSVYPVIALFLLLVACARPLPFEVGTVDSSGVQIVTSDPTNSDETCAFSAEPVLVIGDNEEDDTQWFSVINGMGRLSDGSIVVIDRMAAQVRIFDATGRHLRTMGERGVGPGEFTAPWILWVTPGDTLWVGNQRPWSYSVFTAEGEFVRRVMLDPPYPNPSRGGGVLDNRYTVNAAYESLYTPAFDAPDTMVVEIHDPEGMLVGTLAKVPSETLGKVSGAPETFWVSPLFEGDAEVDARGSTIALAHGSKPELRILDEAFNLRTIIRWAEPDREVTGADLRAWRSNYLEGIGERDEYDDATLSPERPVTDLFPALSSVSIGRDGRIWVRQYDRPREERGWLAFGSDGRFHCRMARLPGAAWEFGADYVLLLHRSELGVQTVRMHSLTSPS